VLSYPAAIPLSTRSLNHLARLIRSYRAVRRSRWRRLDPSRQALLALANLRNGDTLTRLACGFEIGVTTAWRYVREAIDLLAANALTSANVMTFADKAYQGVRGSIRTPFKRHRYRPKLSRWQRRSTALTPGSAPSANAPTPPSKPGKS
jgi:DDE superfamily endonuclease